MTKLGLAAPIAVLCMSATMAFAESKAGYQEYIEACASCHGLTGHGNGRVAEYMNVEVPDLTQISAANDGEFPLYEVISIIDGRTGVRGHGSEMPVWGNRYKVELAPDTGEYGAEVLIRGRILSLATHLEAIQE